MQLYLTVKPGQRVNRIERSEYGWTVRLSAPPVDGKANDELLRFLGRILGLPKSSIKLLKGQSSRIKCVEIPLDQESVEALLSNSSA
ncbi:MAG: DUF167 domain-containing protein [Bacteroidota bacterium]